MNTNVFTFFLGIDWHALLIGDNFAWNALEVVIRVAAAYLMGSLSLTLLGKSSQRKSTPFDNQLPMALGSVIGSAMLAMTVPLSLALIAIVVMTVMTAIMNRVQFRMDDSAKLVNGKARVIVREGKLVDEALERESLSLEHVYSALRTLGFADLSEVWLAYAELDGSLSAFRKDDVEGRAHGLLTEHVENA